jgi:hypothetical protein
MISSFSSHKMSYLPPRRVAELHAQFADLSACDAQAESAKLEQAIKANLRGLGYGG